MPPAKTAPFYAMQLMKTDATSVGQALATNSGPRAAGAGSSVPSLTNDVSSASDRPTYNGAGGGGVTKSDAKTVGDGIKQIVNLAKNIVAKLGLGEAAL